MSSSQIAEFKQFGDRVSRDMSIMNVIASDSREANEMSSRLATANSKVERTETTFARRTAFAERLSTAREHGESISIDIAQDPYNVEMFLRYAEQYGGNSAAAFAMFDAELARQGLRPNHFFSDGTALPTSFNELRDRYDHASIQPELNPDMATIDHQHRDEVSRAKTFAPSAVASGTLPTVREDIQVEGAAIRAQRRSATSDFDARAEIVKTPAGTLASKKSLLKQAGKQLAEDGNSTIDAAKDAVKDLLKKK